MREVGLLLVRSALLVATTHALSSPAAAFRNQHFNPATPIEFDGWHGHESIGIAGADAAPTTIKTQSRRLHLLPNLLPDADRSSLLATLEQKRIEDDVLDRSTRRQHSCANHARRRDAMRSSPSSARRS